MTQQAINKVFNVNVSSSIVKHETNQSTNRKSSEKAGDDDDDLIFGALDDEDTSKEKIDEVSPSSDEGIQLSSSMDRVEKRERSHSSMNDEWENMLPLTESDALLNTTSLPPTNGKDSSDQIIGMSNFRAKHRLRRRSKTNSLVRWRNAVKKAVLLKDPWHDFVIDQYPEENVTRHEFDPVKRTWHISQIKIKIESKPFAHGSMRECFRLKKFSIFSAHHDWDHSSNYIAKRYIDDVPMSRYFDDVMMQMTTKLWGTHYNRHNPPKKVDIVQMSVLEFQDRPGRPYYHLERFIVRLNNRNSELFLREF
ncbi:unnamed protein product [Adineta ricciae]|uniref:Alpha-type protein kinase domain-containing protein n=1 Tax=Adineta ricciae TaxID=249248 RepID=A0A814P981_ADIRI|nr:unnamed protein product [Adineta ricciae]